MNAEELALRRRIDKLDQYATRLHAALTEAERENARLKAELEIAKIQNQYISEVADAYEKDIEKLERERDAAIETLRQSNECDGCKYESISPNDEPCVSCARCWRYEGDDKWEWRGLCAENGGAEDA